MEPKVSGQLVAASPSAEAPKPKLTFASVAASSYISPKPVGKVDSAASNKRPVADQASSHRAPTNGVKEMRPSVPSSTNPTPVKTTESSECQTSAPEARVSGDSSLPKVADVPKGPEIIQPEDSSSNVVVNDDDSTQVSSSEGSGKPRSLGGKSSMSAAAFAMDEKESLRPDDSASLRDALEEEGTSAAGSVAAGSRVGSDAGSHAFRDQLREISVMAPQQTGSYPQYPPQVMPNTSIAFGDGSLLPSAEGVEQVLSITRGIAPGADNPGFGPDDKLLEALESYKDRVWVLKCEQDLINFINNAQETRLFLPPTNSFYRMLAHRMADYYLLGHQPDQTGSAVEMFKTPYTRLPAPLSTIALRSASVEAPATALPLRKIMRRGGDRGTPGTNTASNSEGPSMTTSEAGGDSASEAGNESKKATLSREDREARYREARLRIFGTIEDADPTETSEPVSEDISRSSSTTGRRKLNSSKKQRSDDDDGFEARSAYNQYYGSPVSGEGLNIDALYVGPHSAMTSPMAPAYGQYPQMHSPDAQQGYMWPPHMYAVQPSVQTLVPPGQANFDLAADFQRGMLLNQQPSQMGMRPGNGGVVPTSTPHHYPGQMQGGHQWVSTLPFDGSMQTPQSQFPMAQGAHTIPYAYGQLPAPSFQNGRPLASQHPIPGSFNRQQFNPQSQAFVPGSTNSPQFPVQQPSTVPHAPLAQMPSVRGGGAKSASLQPYSTPPRQHGFSSLPATPSSLPKQPLPATLQASPAAPIPSSVGAGAPPAAAAARPTQQHPLPQPPNPDSTIAKWGTPAHLPPKPPPPTTMQPQRWIETHQRQMQGFGNSPALHAAAAGVARMAVGPNNTGAASKNGTATSPPPSAGTSSPTEGGNNK